MADGDVYGPVRRLMARTDNENALHPEGSIFRLIDRLRPHGRVRVESGHSFGGDPWRVWTLHVDAGLGKWRSESLAWTFALTVGRQMPWPPPAPSGPTKEDGRG